MCHFCSQFLDAANCGLMEVGADLGVSLICPVDETWGFSVVIGLRKCSSFPRNVCGEVSWAVAMVIVSRLSRQ